MGHKVKTHRWFNGSLETLEHFFETFEEAHTFAASALVQVAKIYDDTNTLILSKNKSADVVESYSGYNDTSYA